jgi:hypothetical protein
MLANQRPAAATIAAALVNGHKYRSAYDFTTGRYNTIRVDVDGDQIRAYDYDRSAHIGGRAGNIYDYGVGGFLQFRIRGQTVSGYDYVSGHHFQAKVTGRSVSLYDYETGRHFAFSVS